MLSFRVRSRKASVVVSDSILLYYRPVDGPQRSPDQKSVWTVLDPLTISDWDQCTI
jgi:hypothetical protein